MFYCDSYLVLFPSKIPLVWYHRYIYTVSSNLFYMLELFSTIINTPSLRLAKQHPADGVCPVFMPSQSISINLFVFLQTLLPRDWKFYAKSSQTNYLVDMILRNSVFYTAYRDSFIMSRAVDTFSTLPSPWGLAKLDLNIFSYLPLRFIYLMYLLTNVAVLS